jgi:AcrR family transcriptional regulator
VVVFAGQGDARRSMTLLWRGEEPGEPRTGPGPRPGLTVDAIVDAAVAVADADGMAGLSMRAVGERLGRTAMALYTYVPNKGELLDLMYDRALAELPTGYPMDAGWRMAATRWAEDLLAFSLRHPWVLQISQARPVLGPGGFTVLETVARILHATGLGPEVLRGVVAALFDLVRGAARTIADARRAAAETGVSDEEWWFGRAPLLEEVAPGFASRFPMRTWLESGPRPDDPAPTRDAVPTEETMPADDVPFLERGAAAAFATGLALLLDGVEARVRA